MIQPLRLLRRLRHYPSSALLAVQLVGVVMYALLDDGRTGRVGQVVLSLFGLLVLGMALRVVRQSPAANSWAMGLAASVLVLWIWQWCRRARTCCCSSRCWRRCSTCTPPAR